MGCIQEPGFREDAQARSHRVVLALGRTLSRAARGGFSLDRG
ncbi:hypothetical protein LEMLEM_LOCUS13287, partial [Lemmus lemmus]